MMRSKMKFDVDDGDDKGNGDDNEVDGDDDEKQTKAGAGCLAELNQLGETLQTLGKNALLHKFN